MKFYVQGFFEAEINAKNDHEARSIMLKEMNALKGVNPTIVSTRPMEEG
ncbi:MAG: hypothetical protein GX969_08910 [Firmicutes bacterium]|nr:hypothetical protein [Bacillota bacterium]